MWQIWAIVILWGIPTLLAFMAWWRYRQIQVNSRPPLLRIGMISLVVSEVMLLLIGAAVALESISTVRVPFMPRTVGFTNFLICAGALLTSLTTKTSDTARIWIAATSAYLMVVWLYAMLAH
jgi:energy-converting hydrogenase Eha subunit C